MMLAEYNRRVHPSPVRQFKPFVYPEHRWVRVDRRAINRGKMIVCVSILSSTLAPPSLAPWISALGGLYWLFKL